MQMILKKDWHVIDATEGEHKDTTIPAGIHEIERIPNPFGYKAPWLVLKGTKIGASEGSWRQWAPGQKVEQEGHPNFGKVIDWGELEVVIVE